MVNVLVDPGEGTVNNLYRVGLGIADIDMVIATHDHPDHLVALDEILSLRHERHEIQGSAREGESKPFVILGNPSVVERYAFLNRATPSPGALRYRVAGLGDESSTKEDCRQRSRSPGCAPSTSTWVARTPTGSC